jgi:hypothetical protein
MATTQSQFSPGLANYFCKLKINNIDVPVDSISSIVIRNWIFDVIPRIELTIQDNGTFCEIYPLTDATEILLEIGKSKESNHITTTFILDNYAIDILAGNSSNIITITGFLKYNDFFFPVHTRAFKNQTSISVLEKIAGEAGWTVNNVIPSQSNDKMSWLQINSSNYDFLQHVLKRSSITNDLLIAYAKFNSTFIITSLKTAISQSFLKTCRFDLKKAAADVLTDKNDAMVLWTNGYKVDSIAGYLNKIGGYGLTSSFYDMTSAKTLSSAIDSHPLAKYKSNQSYIGKFVDSINYGSLNANMSNNYYKGQITNRNLMASQFGTMITAKINPLALNKVNLMDVINFTMPSINARQNNEIYSGDYLVCGMVAYSSKSSPLQLEINLLRNGRNKSAIV